MLSEIKSGSLATLMQRRADFEKQAEVKSQEAAEFAERIAILHHLSWEIVHSSPEVGPEEGNSLFSVSGPHHVTAPVTFSSGESKVELRMRELVHSAGYVGTHLDPVTFERVRVKRYYHEGVRIEMVDNNLPLQKRILYEISPHMIKTWDGKLLTSTNIDNAELEVVEALVEQISLTLFPIPENA